MATYKQIQDYVRKNHGFVPRSGWIAHVLSDHGLTKRIAHNRAHPKRRKYPCPQDKRNAIEDALRQFDVVTRAS